MANKHACKFAPAIAPALTLPSSSPLVLVVFVLVVVVLLLLSPSSSSSSSSSSFPPFLFLLLPQATSCAASATTGAHGCGTCRADGAVVHARSRSRRWCCTPLSSSMATHRGTTRALLAQQRRGLCVCVCLCVYLCVFACLRKC